MFKKICNTFTLFNMQIRIEIQCKFSIPSFPHLLSSHTPPKLTVVFTCFCTALCICFQNKIKIQILISCFSRQKLILYRLCSLLCLFCSLFFFTVAQSSVVWIRLSSPLLIIPGLFPEWKFKSRTERTNISWVYLLNFPKYRLCRLFIMMISNNSSQQQYISQSLFPIEKPFNLRLCGRCSAWI